MLKCRLVLLLHHARRDERKQHRPGAWNPTRRRLVQASACVRFPLRILHRMNANGGRTAQRGEIQAKFDRANGYRFWGRRYPVGWASPFPVPRPKKNVHAEKFFRFDRLRSEDLTSKA